MTEEEYTYYPPKPEPKPRPTNWMSSLLSMVLFILLFMILFQGNLEIIILIVTVLFIHEMGHFSLMKLFGYRDVNMFFIPFMGAMVSGEKEDVTQSQRTWVLLAGPVPGIIIGILLFYWGLEINQDKMKWAGLIFMSLNVFNLFPVEPLDGGRLLETLFIGKNEMLRYFFLVASIVLLLWVSYVSKTYLMVFIAAIVFMRLRLLFQANKLRKTLEREKGLNLSKTYSELSDEEYWKIRAEYIKNSPFRKHIDSERYEPLINEDVLIGNVKNLLNYPMNQDMNLAYKLAVLLLWVLSVGYPIFLVISKLDQLSLVQ
jgi:stage IV sporulation protein FB